MAARPSFAGISSKWTLLIYAACVGPIGLFTTLWGTIWIRGEVLGQPYGLHAITRVTGLVAFAFALVAAAASRVADPIDRRRFLGAFALGHALVLVMVLMQRWAVEVWRGDVGTTAVTVFGAITVALGYSWTVTYGDRHAGRVLDLFGEEVNPAAFVRSRYEQQIRLAAAQEERHRLARDLHDSIKQQVFAIHTAAATAEARWRSDEAGVMEAVHQIRAGARDAMTEMDALLDQLRAVPLENQGLIAALRKQADALQLRTGADVSVQIGSLPPSELLAPGAHQAILRAAQEALANVARHARARCVRLSLEATADMLWLNVVDDGAGFDAGGSTTGMGIANMRARAAEHAGQFEITSRPGHGTAVRFGVPYLEMNVADYKRRAIGIALVLAAIGGVTPLLRPGTRWSMLFPLIAPILDLVRLSIGWYRARRLEAGA